jgi:hypothetical protein
MSMPAKPRQSAKSNVVGTGPIQNNPDKFSTVENNLVKKIVADV